MKLRSSVKKKLLTALLIGASISGISGKASFASNNDKVTDMSRSEFVSVSSPEVKRIIDDMSTKRWTVVVEHIDDTPYTYILAQQHLYFYDQSNGGGFRTGLTDVNGHRCFFNKDDFYGEKGWYNVPNYGRCYFDKVRYETPTNCFKNINGETFHFNGNGTVDIGLISVGGNTYRGNSRNGVLVNGWWSEGGNRYLFERSNGYAAHTGWYKDGNAGEMYFGSNGAMSTGVTKVVDSKDKSKNGFYLFKPHGNGANCYVTTGYYLDTRTDKRYYFRPSNGGKAVTNEWVQTGSGYMHFGDDGAMAKGVTDIDGKTYVFVKGRGCDYNYYRGTGWYNDPKSHNRYYFGGYYGEALKNCVSWIDGHHCKFDSEGDFLGYLD